MNSVTAMDAGGGGTTVGGREECRGKVRNSGLSMLLVLLLVFMESIEDDKWKPFGFKKGN